VNQKRGVGCSQSPIRLDECRLQFRHFLHAWRPNAIVYLDWLQATYISMIKLFSSIRIIWTGKTALDWGLRSNWMHYNANPNPSPASYGHEPLTCKKQGQGRLVQKLEWKQMCRWMDKTDRISLLANKANKHQQWHSSALLSSSNTFQFPNSMQASAH